MKIPTHSAPTTMAPIRSQKLSTSKLKPMAPKKKDRKPTAWASASSTKTTPTLSRHVSVKDWEDDASASIGGTLSSDADHITEQVDSEAKVMVTKLSNSEAMDVDNTEMELSECNIPVLCLATEYQ
jgi:hypothetical protein